MIISRLVWLVAVTCFVLTVNRSSKQYLLEVWSLKHLRAPLFVGVFAVVLFFLLTKVGVTIVVAMAFLSVAFLMQYGFRGMVEELITDERRTSLSTYALGLIVFLCWNGILLLIAPGPFERFLRLIASFGFLYVVVLLMPIGFMPGGALMRASLTYAKIEQKYARYVVLTTTFISLMVVVVISGVPALYIPAILLFGLSLHNPRLGNMGEWDFISELSSNQIKVVAFCSIVLITLSMFIYLSASPTLPQVLNGLLGQFGFG